MLSYLWSPKGNALPPHLAPLLPECQFPPVRYGGILGISLLKEQMRCLKAHNLLEHDAEKYHELGNTYMYNLLASLSLVTTNEPANVKTILATEFKSYELGKSRRKIINPVLGDGIFANDGEEWRWTRELLRPAFANTRVKAVDRLEKHVEVLLDRVSQEIDLQPMFFELSTDIAIDFLFGQSWGFLHHGGCSKPVIEGVDQSDLETQRSNRIREFCAAFRYCLNSYEGVAEENSWGILGAFLPDAKFKRCSKIIEAFADQVVQHGMDLQETYLAQKSDTSDYIFLNEMVAKTTDRARLRGEVTNLFLAGRDSTSSLLSNIWFEMAKRPDIWKRLEDEIQSLGGNPPTYDELRDLKFLNALIKESLRLYPIVPENSREAVDDTILPCGGGPDGKSPIFIAKGWVVQWNTWSMHRRKDIYGEDAEDFRPERWLDEGDRKALKLSWEYLPFNAGPRVCIGQQYAITEVCYVIARMVQAFKDLESRDSEPWREKISLTATGLGGCKVALTPRYS